MSGARAQFGFARENTYGVYTAPNRFARFISESLSEDRTPMESESISRSQVQRSDAWVPNFLGVSGDVTVECGVNSFGAWIPALLGPVVSTPYQVDNVTVPGVTQHSTFLPIESHTLESFTMQVGRPFNETTVPAWSYSGMVVTGWELSISVDGFLQLKLMVDGSEVTLDQALAAQVSPAFDQLFSWAGGLIKLDNVGVDVRSFTLKCTYAVKTDRRFIRRKTSKKKGYLDGRTELEWSAELDFENLTHYNKYREQNPESALMKLEASFEALTAIAGTSVKPRIDFTLPAARNDSNPPTVSGVEALTQTIGGKALYKAGEVSALSLVHISPNATL